MYSSSTVPTSVGSAPASPRSTAPPPTTSWSRCALTGARSSGLEVEVRQTDDEAELVGWIHEAADGAIPVVLNPAAFTHYSYALRDACAQLTSTLVEVHLTNPAARETFRHTSVISAVATGTIAGFGVDSYRLALSAIAAAACLVSSQARLMDWAAAAAVDCAIPR